MKNKKGKTITCTSKKCKPIGGYTWLTKSKNLQVCCPRCGNKVKIPQ